MTYLLLLKEGEFHCYVTLSSAQIEFIFRLLIASQKLGSASTAADDSQRMCKVLENKSLSDEARMESLENQLKDARILAEEADRKYDEIAKKLQMVEADLDRAEERAETGESKIIELEEELRVVGKIFVKGKTEQNQVPIFRLNQFC